jgi:hypothetical protein
MLCVFFDREPLRLIAELRKPQTKLERQNFQILAVALETRCKIRSIDKKIPRCCRGIIIDRENLS